MMGIEKGWRALRLFQNESIMLGTVETMQVLGSVMAAAC